MIVEVLERLKKEYNRYRSVLVAFSGGTDSTLLLALFKKLGKIVAAATVVLPYLPSRHVENAKKLAKLIGVPHYLLDGTEIMKVENFKFNPASRCYMCKKYIYKVLKDLAKREGMDVIVDGTNFDDLREERPGLKALREESIRTPLADLELGKDEVRILARQLNLPNWNSPPTTCLLTRLPFGVKITPERLLRIEKAEEFIMKILRNNRAAVRVRDYMDIALIEVSENYLREIFAEKDRIIRELKNISFRKVALDLEGYRRFKV